VFAEAGVRSALGFWLELSHRLGRRLMPPPVDDGLDDVMRRAFGKADDEQWVEATTDEDWYQLAEALGVSPARPPPLPCGRRCGSASARR
jgi:site-specific recombinase